MYSQTRNDAIQSVFFSLCHLRFHISTPITLPESDDLGKKNGNQICPSKLRETSIFPGRWNETKTAVFVFVGKAVSHSFSHFGGNFPNPPFPRPWFGPPSHWGPYFSLHPLWRDAKAGVLFWLKRKSEFCEVFCWKWNVIREVRIRMCIIFQMG